MAVAHRLKTVLPFSDVLWLCPTEFPLSYYLPIFIQVILQNPSPNVSLTTLNEHYPFSVLLLSSYTILSERNVPLFFLGSTHYVKTFLPFYFFQILVTYYTLSTIYQAFISSLYYQYVSSFCLFWKCLALTAIYSYYYYNIFIRT